MPTRKHPRLGRLVILTLAVLPFFLPQPARGGGPKYVAGASYFNPGTMGVPLTWAQGTINYYTDQGDLSPILPGPTADALVADAFSQWTSIATAAVAATRAGQLAEDVSGANVFVNPDGTITMPADILPSATGTPLGIVYDADGTVTDALLGQGAGSASACFSNTVFGGIDNFGTDANFLHALVVVNGNCAQASSQLTDVEYRLVRVLGRVFGLDWSQVNDNVLTHQPPATENDYAGFPVMHASDPPNCIPISICYPNPYQPKMDDQVALSRLYPVTTQNLSNFPGKQVFAAATARIHGIVSFTNRSGQAAQGMKESMWSRAGLTPAPDCPRAPWLQPRFPVSFFVATLEIQPPDSMTAAGCPTTGSVPTIQPWKDSLTSPACKFPTAGPVRSTSSRWKLSIRYGR